MTTLKRAAAILRHGALACAVAFLLSASVCPAQQGAKPAPTHKNVAYGPHERNVFDLWLADSPTPTPLVLYIHGGGFRGGSKESLNAGTLRQLLDAGISVAALNYRLISHERLPAAHYDCRRALQFLRSKADEWNIDKTRVGAFGGSAGAQLCMWLAFHDEMAEPQSSDPVERESTRLACVATNGGQTTMDFQWWEKWIPGYETPHRDPFEAFDAENEEALRKLVADVSALSLITADDPPIHMAYGMAPDAPVPTDPGRARGWKVHHVMFGVKLKEKMDALGIEADLKYPGGSSTYTSVADFFKAKFGKSKKVLLLGQTRDHPPGSHEYMAGLHVLAKCLENTPGLELTIAQADEPWPEGPRLLQHADAVVLYLGQGARWIQADPERLKAMQQLAARGGGIVAVHWAIGAKDAKYIDAHRKLIGGIHGGPDRKYVICEGDLQVADPKHPIASGIDDFRLYDEFYYRLKFAGEGTIQPILQVPIEGTVETVAWAYQRPDGGRSFGFSGMHFHKHWRLPTCRRLIAQAVLWTLRMPIPKQGLAVDVAEEDLKLE